MPSSHDLASLGPLAAHLGRSKLSTSGARFGDCILKSPEKGRLAPKNRNWMEQSQHSDDSRILVTTRIKYKR